MPAWSRPAIVGARMLVVALVAALLGTVLAVDAGAVPSQDELDAAREQAEQLEDAVDDAEAELREVHGELEVLEARLAEAQGELEAAIAVHDEAQAAATAASDRARIAEQDLAAATTELADNRETLGGLARDTYKHGAQAGSPAMAAFELLGQPSDGFADRLHFLQRGVSVRTAALEAAVALRVRVAHLTERARDEERALLAREEDAESARSEAATLHAEVEQLTSETSNNLERADALVRALEGEQDDVAVRISRLEEQVAREREEERRERERREREARERAERERAERERAERERAERERAERRRAERARSSTASSDRSGGSPGGSSGGGGSSTPVATRPGPSSSLRTVGGITVAASLAPQLEALLNHARRDGIVLGGSGYRSPQITARLRRANGCPDVHRSPASSCRVPTARPGTSEHEKGLAVDFTYRGQTICYPRRSNACSGNAAFAWLRRNAGAYGLRNLPSEAWHWSTTGG